VFDQRTGRRQQCNVTFYTKFGQKVDYTANKEGRILATGGTVAGIGGGGGGIVLAK
jgi:hypothetical protein